MYHREGKFQVNMLFELNVRVELSLELNERWTECPGTYFYKCLGAFCSDFRGANMVGCAVGRLRDGSTEKVVGVRGRRGVEYK
jgi:hypothetical protein